jgi:hypothetical protein
MNAAKKYFGRRATSNEKQRSEVTGQRSEAIAQSGIADAHRDDGERFLVRADEKLGTARMGRDCLKRRIDYETA